MIRTQKMLSSVVFAWNALIGISPTIFNYFLSVDKFFKNQLGLIVKNSFCVLPKTNIRMSCKSASVDKTVLLRLLVRFRKIKISSGFFSVFLLRSLLRAPNMIVRKISSSGLSVLSFYLKSRQHDQIYANSACSIVKQKKCLSARLIDTKTQV